MRPKVFATLSVRALRSAVPDSSQDDLIMNDLLLKPIVSDDFNPRAVLAFARRVLGGKGYRGADLDDLAQEVAFTVARRRRSYRADLGKPSQWVSGVIRKTVLEWRRDAGRVVGELVPELPELPVETDTEAVVHAHQRLTAVPEGERRVIELVAKGRTMRYVARAERISASTAHERYLRGLRSLREASP